MSKMITKELYDEIQDYKAHGTSQRETARRIGIATDTVRRWWDWDEESFVDKLNDHTIYLDQYRAYILNLLKLCPQIRETNILYKLRETFPDFECSKTAFYSYMRKLREQTGLEQFKTRTVEFREALPPGYEAQVDFGQFKLPDMYGKNVRVYFFCMVLSYSNMGFVYFSPDPFKTETAIQAHNYAFRYFGGRTQTVMYDQDRVFVVSENLGNIIFVKEFEQYVKDTGYSVVLCRPRNPNTKGRVEHFVKTVKESFLAGRVYTGIDALNSAALAWLDREGNCITRSNAFSSAREKFREESKYLTKVVFDKPKVVPVRDIRHGHFVFYKNTEYEMPIEKVTEDTQIRIEEDNGFVLFYDTDTNELLHKCLKSNDGKPVRYTDNYAKPEAVSISTLKQQFGESETAMKFLKAMADGNPRYKQSSARRITAIAKQYTYDQVITAFGHCVKTNNCNAHELMAYLIYRYGLRQGKYMISQLFVKQCRERALEMREEYNGGY